MRNSQLLQKKKPWKAELVIKKRAENLLAQWQDIFNFHFLRQHLPLKKQVATKDLNGTCIKYSQDEMGMLSVSYDADV